MGSPVIRILRFLFVAACLTGGVSASPALQHPQAIVDRAEEDFAAGRIAESVAGFDRLAALDPEAAPWMWQRGIGLYYLGRFEDCATQFSAYRAQNPADVESAVWQSACLARMGHVEASKAVLEKAGPDPRVMRAEILEMFRGRLAPGVVIGRAAFVADVAQFYARFYAGLYCEVTGDDESSAIHLEAAASERYQDVGGFMNAVAQVHWARVMERLGGVPAVVVPGRD